MDSDRPKEPSIRWGLASFRGRGNLGGISRPIVKYMEYPGEQKLFARWQRRCCLSQSVLQQLVEIWSQSCRYCDCARVMRYSTCRMKHIALTELNWTAIRELEIIVSIAVC